MTLRTRIVAAMVLAALIPMVVVLAVWLFQAKKRADDETARRTALTRKQATILLAKEVDTAKLAADRAGESLSGDRPGLANLLRGPESIARPVAKGVAERYGFDRVEILTAAGATLAVFGTEPEDARSAALTERRQIPAEGESLSLSASRILGETFVAEVAAITSGEAHIGRPGASACPDPRIALPVTELSELCVSVTPADIRSVRLDILRSFAGVAPVALLAAFAVGLVLAARIARPVRALAERAESISAEHSHPITLLPELDETRRMTLAFDQMLDSLASSERRRLTAERVAEWEEIAKRLAHEIKNPLSPIQLAVENLRRTKERAPADFEEAFNVETRTILEEVASLRALVDEFAQFARLPRPRVAVCDPRAILDAALALFSGRIDALRVDVAIDGDPALPSIHADPEQIGRVFKNVVANALDAMEGSPERKLTVALSRTDDRIAFTIRDTGRGFDAEALRHVFTPYFTTRADRGGTGLGMAIARRIAVEHGGSLHAAGAPGRGATITLTLPIAGPPPEGA
jgi:signal transduction histidine kinase